MTSATAVRHLPQRGWRHFHQGGKQNGRAPGGPFVNMAAFCQQVLREKDDTITAVRIVDRVALSPDAEAALRDHGHSVPIHLWSVVETDTADALSLENK